MARTARRWLFLAACIAAVFLFNHVDAGLKTAPGALYAPRDAAWSFAAHDFPRFWRMAAATEAVRAFNKEAPAPLRDFERAVRLAYGIRPTPSRWSLWLGPRLLIAGSENQSGACVRPGLLLRSVLFLKRLVGPAPTGSSLPTFRGLYYAWRDGSLIFSESERYVKQCLSAPAYLAERPKQHDTVSFRWEQTPKTKLVVRAAEGLPVTGQITGVCTDREVPLTMTKPWPSSALLTVTATRWRDIASVVQILYEPFRDCSVVDAVVKAAWAMWASWDIQGLPEGWDQGVAECSFGITGVDTSQTTPVPKAALLMRRVQSGVGDHPLAPLAAELDALPHEWHGAPGVVAPLIGEALLLCLCNKEEYWLAASQEPLMAELARNEPVLEQIDADVALRVDWKETSEVFSELARHAALSQLLPETGVQEIEEKVIPKFRALGQMGALEIAATVEKDSLDFTGHLASHSRHSSGEKP
jgi:hypothetical protein